jgi:hypothetical protein
MQSQNDGSDIEENRSDVEKGARMLKSQAAEGQRIEKFMTSMAEGDTVTEASINKTLGHVPIKRVGCSGRGIKNIQFI